MLWRAKPMRDLISRLCLLRYIRQEQSYLPAVVKDFFEHLDTGCKQYLIDKGTPEFEDACKELIERAGNVQGRTENANIGLNGRWTATMEKMQKYALSQILFDRADAEQQTYIHDLKEKAPDVSSDL